MARKIIQLRTIVINDDGYECALALCEDGTAWVHINSAMTGEGWVKLAPIPQDEDEKEDDSAGLHHD